MWFDVEVLLKRFWGHFVSALTEELFAPEVKGQEDQNQTTGPFLFNFHDIWESYQLNIFSLKLSQTAKTRFKSSLNQTWAEHEPKTHELVCEVIVEECGSAAGGQ